ncbi:biotin/lipoyl-binding protein [Pseudonocardiaceae bacterium YIM PH 21723]|nr:biotin/lipoyl-binding protein [Pseudonocardiaceae bacterium YIM PH 21723]
MITNLLVANRGEIARRVFRSARELGIACTAVYSDADAGAPHVREADAAVRLPGNTPAETYLRGELIIEAAKAAGANAIHPGYGFLSENADFARAVIDAGLIWVGPPPKVIDQMGSKIESKRLMATAGVPVLELNDEQITDADLPVLIKASAGGGGRGMRVVRDLKDLQEELTAAKAEAGSAFGDDTVFIEPYIEDGRHIEVQIMADSHGTVWALGERECSIQRRHQKIIEETPSPLVERTDGMREKLLGAATAAAQAIGYIGAGTMEFLADEQGRFFFLECNTRLQVEHPVTECVTGVDLVREQLLVAAGERLADTPPAPRGHAIEVRLYAETPDTEGNWTPQTGPVHRITFPEVRAEFAIPQPHGLRLDSGVEDGSVVGVHYDPMLAKVIAYAPTRTQATGQLAGALSRAVIHGLRTNRDALVRILRTPEFASGDTRTSFFAEQDMTAIAAPLADEQSEKVSALAAALAAAQDRTGVLSGLPSGWRSLASQPQRRVYSGQHGEHTVDYLLTRDGLAGHEGVKLLKATASTVDLEVSGVHRSFAVNRYGDQVFVDSALGPVALAEQPRFVEPGSQVAPGSLVAPMPGTVIRVVAEQGQQVEAGQVLLYLEAMKMEHRITAPNAGVLSELAVQQGQQVDQGAVLAVITVEEQS